MKIYRGKLVLTDADSEIGPALIVVKDGKIIEVVKGTTEIPTSLEHVDQVRTLVCTQLWNFMVRQVNFQSNKHTQSIF